ncbi:hypothetical protein BLA29_015058 [Euroglyphus maynei]|uniref:Uncharacterized protein n=1 Tax=Euroglyphus maynei TaxID=6958 RepID=A0A1Y3BIQ8_EURMA|nr:hypothetical protein BLA29_015058 [Euroglyphus maynei]
MRATTSVPAHLERNLIISPTPSTAPTISATPAPQATAISTDISQMLQTEQLSTALQHLNPL